MTETSQAVTDTSPAAAPYRKKPVVVHAVRWTGGNADVVHRLTGSENFTVLDEADRANCDDPDATASVYDKLHSTWVLVFDGQWIIKGIKGEFYPIADDVFHETHAPAEDNPALRLLALELPENDAHAPTPRAWLTELLKVAWLNKEDAFKRPFGWSGPWWNELYAAMVRAGLAEGEFSDEDDTLSWVHADADKLILAAIDAMAQS